MKQMEEIKQVSQLYKVLSDPTRLRILLLLKEGEHNVTAISEQLEMAGLSRHVAKEKRFFIHWMIIM